MTRTRLGLLGMGRVKGRSVHFRGSCICAPRTVLICCPRPAAPSAWTKRDDARAKGKTFPIPAAAFATKYICYVVTMFVIFITGIFHPQQCRSSDSHASRRELQDRWNTENGIGEAAQAERMEANQVNITLGSLGSTGSRVRIDGDV